MNIPQNQPISSDIEDRRNGTTFTQRLSAKVHELMSNVSDDYNDSFGNKNMTMADIPDVSAMQPPPVPGTPAGNAVHAQIHQLLGGTPAALTPNAASRVRATVNGQ